MKLPERLKIGECGQFYCDWAAKVLACQVTGYDGPLGMVITYRNPDTGEVIKGGTISVFDLVSDEDTVIHEQP